MAERNKLGRPFGCHDSRNASHGQDIAFLESSFAQELNGFRLGANLGTGLGDALSERLCADVDHVDLSLLGQMGESRGSLRFAHAGLSPTARAWDWSLPRRAHRRSACPAGERVRARRLLFRLVASP